MPETPPGPERDQAQNELDELVGEFLLESHEGLDRMDHDLPVPEREANSPVAIARLLRAMHTIKGTCGFLGFAKTEAVAHAAESLLGGLRDGEFSVTPEIVTALLSAGDVIRRMLREIESTGTEGATELGQVVEALGRLGGSRVRPRPARPAWAPSPAQTAETAPADEAPSEPADEAPSEPTAAAPAPAFAGFEAAQPAAPQPETSAETHSVTDSAVRVDVGLLDGLMTLVG